MNADVYNALALLLQGLGVAVTCFSACLIIRQIKIATQASRFDAMKRINELMRNIDNGLYALPSNIVYRQEEFPENPPPRYDIWMPTAGESDIMNRARNIRADFFEENGGYKDFETMAQKAIDSLNDIAQYLEDGYANYLDVLGQYHLKILRIVHMVEAFRFRRDEQDGDYGHRLLRLRQKAVHYHYMRPKHSDRDVKLKLRSGEIITLLPRLSQSVDPKRERKKHYKAFFKKR